MTSPLPGFTARPRVRWRQSLIFRTTLLCVTMLLCLLGAVYILSTHYVGRVVREMREQTEAVAQNVEVHLSEQPDADLKDLGQQFGDGRMEIEFEDLLDEDVPLQVSLDIQDDGTVIKVARTTIQFGDRLILMTARITLSPQTEIVSAFRNEYLLAVTFIFVGALLLMIYFIVSTLRPLHDLSETCAQISAGNLRTVEVRRNAGEVLALEQTFNAMVASLREKENVEAKLRQAQRLSAIGNLAAGIAHDLRNPLNAIKLLSSHTIDTLQGGRGDEGALRSISTIRDEVNRLEDIVSGFLSLAREHELEPEPMRVDALLEDCLRLLRKDAESRGIRLQEELHAGNTTLLLDPKQWSRAILNVVLNALDACPKGGRVRVFSRITDTTCEVEVRDDGPGLGPEAAEHAFDPYFTTKPTGTGLGLSITRGIVQEHGGTIELHSYEGHGCQVLITMPLHNTVQAGESREPRAL
jgi:signal transduction histidine kinase